MSDVAEITAALDWAARMESGELDRYDPYIVALAAVVREQRTQLEQFEAALGAAADRPADWRELLREVGSARARIAALEQALESIAPFDPLAAIRMRLDDEAFRVMTEREAAEVAHALDRARKVLREG